MQLSLGNGTHARKVIGNSNLALLLFGIVNEDGEIIIQGKMICVGIFLNLSPFVRLLRFSEKIAEKILGAKIRVIEVYIDSFAKSCSPSQLHGNLKVFHFLTLRSFQCKPPISFSGSRAGLKLDRHAPKPTSSVS